MPFLIDEAFLPATLTSSPMTDSEFAGFCAEHPDLFFEMTADGDLIVRPPNYTLTGIRNSEISGQLANWARKNGAGLACDSSTGFLLPNGARRSPDESWTPKADVKCLPESSRDGYWHFCPPFVIELRSNFDRLPTLRTKMQEYMANGARLGWLIDPDSRTVEVYRPERQPEVMSGVDSVVGEDCVEGFVLDLRAVWDPFSA